MSEVRYERTGNYRQPTPSEWYEAVEGPERKSHPAATPRQVRRAMAQAGGKA